MSSNRRKNVFQISLKHLLDSNVFQTQAFGLPDKKLQNLSSFPNTKNLFLIVIFIIVRVLESTLFFPLVITFTMTFL